MKIALICNRKKDKKTSEAKKLARSVEVWLKERNHTVFSELNVKISKSLDLAVVFGGDGLVLYTANQLAGRKVPILRVNFGNRGFLTNVEPDKLFDSLEKILKGDFHIEARNRVVAEIFHRNKMIEKIDALNEIVIGGINRTVSLSLEIKQRDKIFSAEAHGDGIIVSTKTGSTAYNMNSGGAVLLAEDIFSVVANNCFFVSDFLKMRVKSFIVSDGSEFKIKAINQNKLNLPYAVADGQRSYKMKKDDYLIIKKSLIKTFFLEIGKDKK
jgi:NAD+ kinase